MAVASRVQDLKKYSKKDLFISSQDYDCFVFVSQFTPELLQQLASYILSQGTGVSESYKCGAKRPRPDLAHLPSYGATTNLKRKNIQSHKTHG